MGVKIVLWKDTDISVEQLHLFIVSVFKERLEQGLNFKIATSTLQGFESYLANNESYTFVALDPDDGTLLGTSTIIFRKRKGRIYGHHGLWAVKAQGLGIGALLVKRELEFAKERRVNYVESDTAEEAISSVRAHFKSGFHRAGYYSFPFTNYYSLYFRQICSDSHIRRFVFHHVFYPVRFGVYYLGTRLLYNKDGSLSLLGKGIKGKR